MIKLLNKIKKISQGLLINSDINMQTPLLDNDEILTILQKVKSSKNSSQLKHDIAFRKTGDVRSIYRGQGMDYEESRQYQPGDDPRYMNWQLTAKTGQHYMKVFREERQPGVFILVDRRQSMRFGTQQRLKITQAARMAAITAFTAQEKHFSIGGVIVEDKLEWFKENQNKQAVFDFIHQAARPAPPLFYKKPSTEPDILNILKILIEVLTAGSTIYLISDFHDLDKESQSVLLKLSSLHQINAIQITDPAEITLPNAGIINLKSSVTSKAFNINSNSSVEQIDYKNKSTEFFSLRKDIFKNTAIPYQQILTTDNLVEDNILVNQ